MLQLLSVWIERVNNGYKIHSSYVFTLMIPKQMFKWFHISRFIGARILAFRKKTRFQNRFLKIQYNGIHFIKRIPFYIPEFTMFLAVSTAQNSCKRLLKSVINLAKNSQCLL